MKIKKYIIERITQAARIEEVAADFLTLRKTGVRYTALCPFHEDRHDGNFIIYPKGNCYKCFTCGAGGDAVSLVMKLAGLDFMDAIRWLGRKYNIETDMGDFDYTPPPKRQAPPPLPMLTLPWWMVTAREKGLEGNNLVRWMTGIQWDSVQRQRIGEVLADYHVGHSKMGHTIFWQIDDRHQVRTGKMMLYGHDGHRDKVTKHNFDWIHSALFRDARSEYDEKTVEVEPTLFGLHLIDRYPHATANIVESEKTALLMAIAYGNNSSRVWLACGGLNMLSRKRLAPIIKRGRDIMLYPDRDGVEAWTKKAEELACGIHVDCTAVTEWWKEEDGPKADIADVVVRIINEGKKETAKPLTDIPAVRTLIDNLDLEEVIQ